jgi:hypothetical protein
VSSVPPLPGWSSSARTLLIRLSSPSGMCKW